MFRILFCLGLIVCQSVVFSGFIYPKYDDSLILKWWQSGVIYQVYVRSFKDSDGDGIGDLHGLTEKIEYLKDLGVGAIWLSPIFKSPQYDIGYDISDYRDIDPSYGTLDDFDKLIDESHKAGIKVILDFVPNHSSHEHEWFKKSVKRIAPYTDYYVWKDAAKNEKGERIPPNNWLSVFNSGSAWEWDEERQQYYFHQFLVQQPDLNYRCPALVEEIKNVMRYWLDRGVDGFRFDAVPALFEVENLMDEPKSSKSDALPTDYDYLDHPYTQDQPETFDMVQQWREVLDSYENKGSDVTKFFMVETYSPIDKIMKYYGTDARPGAHFPFNFFFIQQFNRQSNASKAIDIVASWLDNLPAGKWPNWVFGNHDQPRLASRLDSNLVDGIHMIQLLLPGTTVTYNGDELGMENTFIRWDQTVDNAGLNVGSSRYQLFSRDPERSPFIWNDDLNAGFSSAKKTWLPVDPSYWINNVEAQSYTNSHLKVYKQLVQLRKSKTITHGDLQLFEASEWVFGFIRALEDYPTYIVVVNLGSEYESIDLQKIRPTLPRYLRAKIYSINHSPDVKLDDEFLSSDIRLTPKSSYVLTTADIIENDTTDLK
ncbi:maltase A1-like [Daktulosphaira vitifoliae]|uniref:maltase A1-like n=1 Tax=Daktulosphaira vitifoliae TaxID=58002 RepID=UPI0021A9B6AF|nr:maltase A1-like [Daktulosphaira vitifoliae]